ncbi:Peroxiredoxin [Halogranum gelatinilyticum]|uniref:Peroxiredoxin n=1 Tax=Halogranum gelatinilyticum TaxID=660521 RepID=A0A1G9R4T5_9EURY|nr:redoxin domain-containing protein [Halogranum gelatinilyticum]SDM18131.1 Peroxiredoxin [Halogranum gelatinilyticum]
MVDVGDDAPDFTAPFVTDEIGPKTLSELLDDEAPVVLAFFPGAFTSVCTDEMCTFQDELTAFEDVGATVYGVSVDTPFALQEFKQQNDLTFGLVSDTNKELIDAYDIEMDFADFGYYGVAKRSVFVVDADGEITYSWVSDDPGVEPDYEEVEQAAVAAASPRQSAD